MSAHRACVGLLCAGLLGAMALGGGCDEPSPPGPEYAGPADPERNLWIEPLPLGRGAARPSVIAWETRETHPTFVLYDDGHQLLRPPRPGSVYRARRMQRERGDALHARFRALDLHTQRPSRSCVTDGSVDLVSQIICVRHAGRYACGILEGLPPRPAARPDPALAGVPGYLRRPPRSSGACREPLPPAFEAVAQLMESLSSGGEPWEPARYRISYAIQGRGPRADPVPWPARLPLLTKLRPLRPEEAEEIGAVVAASSGTVYELPSGLWVRLGAAEPMLPAEKLVLHVYERFARYYLEGS